MSKTLKVIISLLFISLFSYALASIRVSKSLNKDDLEIIKLLDLDNECMNVNSYEDEIYCIKSVQQAQLKLIEGTTCRKGYINLGAKEVINSNTACCFDRSRIIEQTLHSYGFKTRHIFLIASDKYGFFSLLTPGNSNSSHAVSEVLTSKGWLGIDSNEAFLLLDNENLPKTYKESIKTGFIKYLSNKPDYYNRSFIQIIGLYSRNGKFFKPYIPYFPELNIKDFFRYITHIENLKPEDKSINYSQQLNLKMGMYAL